MSFATFADLKSNVRSVFNDRADIPSFVYELMTSELNTRLRLMAMETSTSLAVSGESTALPADFLEARHVYLDQVPRKELELASEFAKTSMYRSSGEPRTYTIVNGFMLLNPVPDGAYTVLLRYIAALDDFADDSGTNVILTTYPALYLYGALKHAAAWEGDAEAAAGYETMLEREIDRVNKREMRSRFSGGPLRTFAGSAP